MKKKYDFIFSIGLDCACTTYLRNNNLQFESYPFDWLTYANLNTRLDLILNNFKDFLNFNDLTPLVKDPNIVNDNLHDYYENSKNNFWYFHEFPSNKELKDSFPEVKEKYNRRITRLYDSMAKHDNILIVWISRHDNKLSDSAIIEYGKRFNEKFNKHIDFLIFENHKEYDDNVYDFVKLNQNIIKCRIAAYPEGMENDTFGNQDICNQVFKDNFKLNIPLKTSLRKRLVRFIAMFIFFNKDLRRLFRKKYL